MHRPAPRTLKNQSNFLIHCSFRTVMACSFNSCAYLIGAHPDWAASLPLLSAVPAGCKSHFCSSLCLAAWAGSKWAITQYHMAREEADVAYPSCQAYFLGFHHHNNPVTCKDNQESEPTAFTCSSRENSGRMIASTSAPSCLHQRPFLTQARPTRPVNSIRGRRKELQSCRADAGNGGSDKGTSSVQAQPGLLHMIEWILNKFKWIDKLLRAGGDDTTESLFMRELKRRGLSSKQGKPYIHRAYMLLVFCSCPLNTKIVISWLCAAETGRRTQIEAPPRAAPQQEQTRSQLEVSRALNSEGLEVSIWPLQSSSCQVS